MFVPGAPTYRARAVSVLALPPAPGGPFPSWDGGGPVAGVSLRDEQGITTLRATSYFLPGLRCPEQIGSALFFGIGNRSSPTLSRPTLETWTGSWDNLGDAAARVCPKLEAQAGYSGIRSYCCGKRLQKWIGGQQGKVRRWRTWYIRKNVSGSFGIYSCFVFSLIFAFFIDFGEDERGSVNSETLIPANRPAVAKERKANLPASGPLHRRSPYSQRFPR